MGAPQCPLSWLGSGCWGWAGRLGAQEAGLRAHLVSVAVILPQELQNDLDRETSSLQELEAQKQDAQDRLDEMDQQKARLRDMLSDVRQKCQGETQLVRALRVLPGVPHSCSGPFRPPVKAPAC